MASSTLEDRALASVSLIRQTGDSGFPFTHPDYPHGAWLTEEKRAALPTGNAEPVTDPFEPGRAGGLRLWELAAAPTPWTEFRTMSAQRTPAFRKTNTTWLEQTVPAFYRVGTVQDGEVIRRPKSPAIVDLMAEPDGWRLLEVAHALAHRAEIQQKFKPQGYGLYGSLTINWVARLAAALRYGFPIDVSGLPPPATAEEAAMSHDAFYRYGISLSDSNCFQAPFLRVPCIGRHAPVPDRDICFMAVGVYIEPHPKGFTDGTGKWLEVNRWSCSPTMVSIAGWELADVVFRQQPNALVSGWSTPEYVIAAPALQPYDTLGEYVLAAVRARGPAIPDGVRYWTVREFLRSRACEELVASSPPLPCRDCLRLNMRAEGVPGKPQCSPPKEKPNPKSPYLTREEREWLEWDSRVDAVFDTIEKAVVFHESRVHGNSEAKRLRRARKKAYRERCAALARIASLTAKAERAYRGGCPSKAAALMAEARELQEKARSGIITSHEEKGKEGQEEEAGASRQDQAASDAPLD